ncbi:MAG: hypothetical protein Q8O99_00495 [bacterium]|nr:hypothetical protein [bacterium]
MLVAFTSSIIGSPDKLLRDFGDSFLTQGSAPTHLFTQAGTYTVIVKALFGNQTVVGMLPVLVGTDLSLQAGLEAVTKQLIA